MIKFSKATGRNTPVYDLHIGRLAVLISYETVVAASYRGKHYRLANHWGPTTGRHVKEGGVHHYEIIEDDAFEQFLKESLGQAVLDGVTERLLHTT